MNESSTSAAAPKEQYERPEVEIVGSVADLTLNDFSKGNDVGGGKSGGSD